VRRTIVYVHPHLMMRTGATNFVLVTASGLQTRGWPVVIVTGQADPAIVGDRKLEIVELGGPLPSDPRHWLRLGGLERRVFAALDHISHNVLFPQVHPANYWAFAYKAARPWVPCVWMCHEPSAFVHSWDNIRSLQGPMRVATMAANPPLQVIDRLLVAQADHIVANSRFTAANVQRIYRRAADAVVDSGVGPEAFAVPCVPRDCILTLGSLTRFKRVDLAVQGYALAHSEMGDALPPLVIGGDGPEAPALRALVTGLGLAGRVHFAGKVSDQEKRMLYARALVFVSTAPREPFGLVCVEAMAAGAPALAPDCGGPSETVVDGETGALYRAGDATDLARRLVALLDRRADAARMSEAARLHVRAHYTLENTVDQLDRALSTL
jgi:glycosyltransferase involved in cell wall biosynthesis